MGVLQINGTIKQCCNRDRLQADHIQAHHIRSCKTYRSDSISSTADVESVAKELLQQRRYRHKLSLMIGMASDTQFKLYQLHLKTF